MACNKWKDEYVNEEVCIGNYATVFCYVLGRSFLFVPVIVVVASALLLCHVGLLHARMAR